jgi:hypothetical protein
MFTYLTDRDRKYQTDRRARRHFVPRRPELLGARPCGALPRDTFATVRNGVSAARPCPRRWNRVLANAGIERRLALPHVGFNRQVGLLMHTKLRSGFN